MYLCECIAAEIRQPAEKLLRDCRSEDFVSILIHEKSVKDHCIFCLLKFTDQLFDTLD